MFIIAKEGFPVKEKGEMTARPNGVFFRKRRGAEKNFAILRIFFVFA